MFKNIRESELKKENARGILEAKILDKYKFASSRNKITNTDFLNCFEKNMAEKFLDEKSIQNYVFFRRKWGRFGAKYFGVLSGKIKPRNGGKKL